MAQAPSKDDWVETRGVWRAPYLRDGAPVLLTTDSLGRELASVALHRGLSASRARQILREVLDAVDPRFLRLVVDDEAQASVTRTQC